MQNADGAVLTELSNAELDLVGGGGGKLVNLNLAGLVNINNAVVIQTGLNLSVLGTYAVQAIGQTAAIGQVIQVS